MRVFLALLGAIAMTTLAGAQAPKTLDDYDVIWTTPSTDAAGSMPIGNGEVVLNAWVEKTTGDLLFYIARSDALSEISRVLKLGRVRIHFAPSPFESGFVQRLRLRDGTILLGKDLRLFVDPSANVVHLVGRLPKPTSVEAAIEDWRGAPRELPKEEQASAWSAQGAPFPLVESADLFEPSSNALVWYHRNETSIVPKLWEEQSLTGLPGAFDPLLHRTFGGRMTGSGLSRKDERTLSGDAIADLDLSVATASAQTATPSEWLRLAEAESAKSPVALAEARNRRWWSDYWARSWVFASGDSIAVPVPANGFPIRIGVDSNGQNRFPGRILDHRESVGAGRLDLRATIELDHIAPGRIFDKLTAGRSDGFLFDTHPGDALRLIVGDITLTAPHCLKPGRHEVAAVYDAQTGAASISLDGKIVAERAGETGSAITRGYVLQRYVQACQGRGAYPIKFNGGFYTVEPIAMGKPFNADWRNWGDAHWWQNVRHMYHPMMASGDAEMTEPLFRMYESVRNLAESRTRLYHHAEGAYFPETMTVFGTYAGSDYGWDRAGHEPNDVQSEWWRYAWNQGPELVCLMLDRWDYSRDEAFLRDRVLPMAVSVLRYFDTRFPRDPEGRLSLTPTQVVETYWEGVLNDMPSTAGLIAVTDRLCRLPERLTSHEQREFFQRMRRSCPELPVANGALAPAQQYVDRTSNCENGELYAVWPFGVVSLSHPGLLAEAKKAYAQRKNHLDVGWGYDGNVAARLGMTDEAARILQVKAHNSNSAYRWPATWGPNFDWLPDQNHGGNLLTTAELMLMQADPMESGGAIRLLPAWPRAWSVDFKLHAPGNTIVHCVARHGTILKLEVTPPSRRKDVILPQGWTQAP